ncbi:leucine-rich repeat protein [Anaerocolumna sp. MB42-C2]|uniref:leucine-rich repeat protein n=1 Tax=Anaerocolumna sp. MB42-C2 TaxID=3070997 RepID=UPI0027E16F41|nr:leucine-rich repeat protein [Anaerocolumna sp. MB42-C2]WMJ86081.1 leucine-rich repeat protein [Anaerocolumna sp. MB42-C2]
MGKKGVKLITGLILISMLFIMNERILGAIITYDFESMYEGQTLKYSIVNPGSEEKPGTVMVTGIKGQEYSFGDVVIPETVSNTGITYKVTQISDSAFSGCMDLDSIQLPETITVIGDSAFAGCGSLHTVNIPESVTDIGDYAFRDCFSLNGLTISSGVKSIGEGTFYNCTGLKNILFPEGITSIGKQAFYSCRNLTKVHLPGSLKTIGESSFSGCTGLTDIKIPESVTRIEMYAFTACKSLKGIQFPKKLTSIEAGVLSGCIKLKSFIIPEGVKRIGSSAFDSCTGLENIKIPYKVTSIGAYAFNKCGSLKKLYIPVSVKSIREYAFTGTKIDFIVSKNSYGAAYLKENAYSYTYLTDSLTKKIALEDILIKQKDIRIYPGEKVTLSVIYYPGNTTDNRKISWSSNNKKVAAVDVNGRITAVSSGSATITAMVGNKKTTRIIYVELNPPKTVKAVSNGYNSIKVTWTKVDGASGYRVYRSTSKDKGYLEIANVSNTSVMDINLGKGRTYYYKISARGYTGKTELYSNYSKVVSAKPIPAVPAKVKAAAVSENSIKLSWSPVNGAVGYSVYKADSKNGTYKWLGNVRAKSYTDPSLKTGKTYYYKVRAYNYNYVGNTKVFGVFSSVVYAKP